MSIYDLTTLTVRVATQGKALPAIQEHLPALGGELLGVWNADIGALNEILIFRRFDDANALMAARAKLLAGPNPLGCAEWLEKLDTGSYARFPWLPEVETGARGPVYELRTYGIRYGALDLTIDAWEKAMPARGALSPLVGAFYALDGESPRFLNIWPYASVDERSRIRAEAVATGVWPPVGGPANLTHMKSTIGIPAAFSPLR